MKTNYMNPMIEICLIGKEDVIRTSTQELMQGEWGRSDNLTIFQ